MLEGLLEKILPNYDKDRVYKSDLRKIFQWYNILIKAGIKIKETAEKAASKDGDTEEKEVKKAAPKKAAPKKAAPKAKGGKPSSAKKSGPTKTGSQRGK